MPNQRDAAVRKELKYVLREAARAEVAVGRIDRREFMTRSLVAGLGLAGVGAIAKSSVQPAAGRALSRQFK
jgi:hypothetical protein